MKELTPEDAAQVTVAMREAVEDGFAMALPMNSPERMDASKAAPGFGAWLPLYAALVSQAGVDPDATLRLRVDRAFALLAGLRRSEGWRLARESYAQRAVKESSTHD